MSSAEKFLTVASGQSDWFTTTHWSVVLAAGDTGSVDDSTGEDRYRLEPVDALDAEKLYQRRWALTLLDQARDRLKEEF